MNINALIDRCGELVPCFWSGSTGASEENTAGSVFYDFWETSPSFCVLMVPLDNFGAMS